MRCLKKLTFLLILASIFVEAFAKTDSTDFQRFSLVPVLGYTEETEFQYGFMGLLFLRPNNPEGKVPELGLTLYGSTRGQLQFSFEPYYYLYKDLISLWSCIKYQDWVAGYYGKGNDPHIDDFVNFDRKRFQFNFKIQSSVFLPKTLNYGLEFQLEHSDITFSSNEVSKNLGKIPPTHSGFRNGVGYLFAYDSRDNSNWSRHGFFAEWRELFFSDKLGDYTFNISSLDLRGYTELPQKFSAAFGALWQRATGNVPFDMLAGPDGVKRFRGIESLYFNGNQSVILQAEIRKYLGYRLGSHLFLEGGKAGDYFSDLYRNDFHKSIGIGALLGLNLKENLFARADFSWVDFDHLGLSFYVRQAF